MNGSVLGHNGPCRVEAGATMVDDPFNRGCSLTARRAVNGRKSGDLSPTATDFFCARRAVNGRKSGDLSPTAIDFFVILRRFVRACRG
jgi:hypothetical protein